jgi:uncharacterized pyridoxamine 5'-phosphate oxidase family protein
MHTNPNVKISPFLITFIILSFIKVNAQNNTTFTVTPEINKTITKEYPSLFEIYRVHDSIIDYYEYENGEIVSNEYKNKLAEVEKLKDAYEKYASPLVKVKENLLLSAKLIDDYLNSDLKFDEKVKYLIQSQEIATNNGFGYVRLAAPDYRELYIYKGSKPVKSELKIFKDYILNSVQNINPEQSEIYIQYKLQLEGLEKIPKMIPGVVKSKNLTKKRIELLSENIANINTFVGTFQELPGEVYVSKKDLTVSEINKDFIKNEIVYSESTQKNISEYYVAGTRNEFTPFWLGLIIEEINTKEKYYIPKERKSYLNKLEDFQKDAELHKILNDLGYTEYERDNKLYIKTKTAEIELKKFDNPQYDHHLYDQLKENPNFLSDFDNDYNKLLLLRSQCQPYKISLNNYLDIYNVKRALTPTATINAWIKNTKDANVLFESIFHLETKYAYIYDFSHEDLEINSFLEKLSTSKNLLGISK